MSVVVYQTFEVKQDKFKEAMENLQKIKEFRNENYNHKVEVLTPITGNDYKYVIMATYEGLAEMEWQNKKMFDDDDYLKLIGDFFLENIVQGSLYTQLWRTMSEKEDKKKKDS